MMTRAKTPLHQRKLDAQTRASSWLADANELMEAGEKEKAERYYEKAQFWLDRANALQDQRWMAKCKA